MTNKEKEILDIIKTNPSIEQNDIAGILGIKRSTVAVHINNLIKQGYISKKSYIINDIVDNYVLGIGSCNVDIYGKSNIKIKTHYDHPATIYSSVGGVTRNILNNLVKLGVNSKLITAIGDDMFGKQIVENCISNNIDVSDILHINNQSSGLFMQIQDDNNDMYLALCDMSAIEKISPDYIERRKNIILNSKVVLIDPSLPIKTIEKIIELCKGKVPLYLDPISDNYALKIKEYISEFTCIKPNKTELEIISGIKINNNNDIIKACEIVIKKGCKSLFVSEGKDGILYMDSEGICIKRSFKPITKMVNASGAGDALMAAIIYGKVNNVDIDTIIDYGLAAGIATIMDENTINPKMSIELLNKIVKESKL